MTDFHFVQFDFQVFLIVLKFTDTDDLFVVLPVSMVAAFSTSTSGAAVAPTAGNIYLLSIKNNFIHQIHQAYLSVNEKIVEDVQQQLYQY